MNNENNINAGYILAAIFILMIFTLTPLFFNKPAEMNDNTEVAEDAVYSVDQSFGKPDDQGEYKAEITSYTDKYFGLALYGNHSSGEYVIPIKNTAGNFEIVNIPLYKIDVIVLGDSKAEPYVTFKVEDRNNIDTIKDVKLYVPSEYSIDTYDNEESIQYSIVGYHS